MTVPEGHGTKPGAGARARRGAALVRATRVIDAELDKLESGGRLPSQRELAGLAGVSLTTVAGAMAIAVEQERVVARGGTRRQGRCAAPNPRDRAMTAIQDAHGCAQGRTT